MPPRIRLSISVCLIAAMFFCLPVVTAQRRLPPGGSTGSKQSARKPNIYDLSKDIGEQKDLAASRPEIVERLKTEFAKWEAQMKEPMWPCRKPGGDWQFEGLNLDPCI